MADYPNNPAELDRELVAMADKLIPRSQSVIERATKAIKANQNLLDRLKAEHIGLQVGMSLEQARQVLRGWRDHPGRLIGSIHICDFTRREGPGSTLRLTFENGRLLIWGKPSDDRGDTSGAGGDSA